jgi:hypothetical protein
VKEGKGVDEGALATLTSSGGSTYRKYAKFEVNTAFLFQTSDFTGPSNLKVYLPAAEHFLMFYKRFPF